MRIAVDARPLQGETKHRGIGKALERTLLPLSSLTIKNDDQLVLIYDPKLPKPDLPFADSVIFKSYATPNINKKKYIRVALRPFKKLALTKKDADCLLQFDFSLGVPKNVPTVVLFHDLIPILFRSQDLKNQRSEKGIKQIKQALGGKMHWSRYTRDLKVFQNAAKVLAISKSSKSDLLKFDNSITPKKVGVAYLGIDAKLSTSSNKELGKNIKEVLGHRYLLYVGGIDTRKNIAQLVREFYALKKDFPDLRLVVVGKEFSLSNNLKQVGWTAEVNKHPDFAKDIIIPGFVSDYELQKLYENARCFVFPSLYEGFGLPVLEAMALSCPVVTYKNSSIGEIAGDAALLVDSGKSMNGVIKSLLLDKKLRQKLIKKGLKQYLKFPWSKTAEVIYKSLEDVSL